MDPTQKGFDELERAFEQANFLSLDQPQPEPRKYNRSSHRTSRSVPTTYADIPSSDSEIEVSPVSNDDSSEAFDVTITPPPERQGLSRHNSGLPPTPPTMTNSDIMEPPKQDRNVSPVPLFADRVRNALESQKSGHSSPVVGQVSPPTPGTSPPNTADNLHPPRPSLVHSQSSYAESFKTATEGLGNSCNASRSTSQAQLRANDIIEEKEVETENKAPAPLSGLPAYRENLNKHLVEDSDRSEARVRVKNYQTESDSDLDKGVSYIASDADDTPPSPTTRKALNHRAAFQRLRRPFQPGDEIKRPDASLLYGSSRSWQPKKKADLIRAPKREMSAEFMRNAGLVKVNLDPEPAPSAPELPVEAAPTAPSPTRTPAPAPIEPPLPPSEDKPSTVMEKAKEPIMDAPLQEFAPTAAPLNTPSPPTTAAKQSLEDNNQVYKLIQAHNVKRHSAISDGSVQAVVVARPEQRRTLRHTKKRDSLRGNVSVASPEPNDKEDGEVKLLRRKRGVATLSPHETARRAVSDQHGVNAISAAVRNPVPRSFSAGPENAQAHSSRLHRDGNHAKGRSEQQSPRERFKTSTPSVVANESRRLSSAPAPKPRPWSMDLSTVPQATPSPRLRRCSRDDRLDNNLSVRRTSIDHTALPRDHVAKAANEKPVDFPVGNYATLEEARRDRAEWRWSRTSQDINEPSRATFTPLNPEASPLFERRASRTRDMPLELPTSPKRKSLDPRYLHSTGTPFSTSQFSDRTAMTEAELCEARGVEIYPHNNKSLLLVQQSAQPAVGRLQLDTTAGAQQPVFKAVVEAPEGEVEDIGRSKHTVDSPLTNPRAAPEPPVIKFIPPTPNEEIERILGDDATTEKEPKDDMQQRPSLKARMRRFSENLIEPLPFGRNGSLRKANQPPPRDERPTHLSSNWVPNDIWADDDSFEDEDEEEFEHLPPGGDTSNVESEPDTFPRKMSKRMPGFRGKGGFLQGNSLGIDRHGTNNRRHHVSTRTSQEMLSRMTRQQKRRGITLPFGRGTKLEYIGFAGLGTKMREVRRRKEEKAREKRRDELRSQIGVRLFHDA